MSLENISWIWKIIFWRTFAHALKAKMQWAAAADIQCSLWAWLWFVLSNLDKKKIHLYFDGKFDVLFAYIFFNYEYQRVFDEVVYKWSIFLP